MEKEEIIKVLRALAEGVDPISGEEFPAGSPYQNPKIVRALFATVFEMEQLAAIERRRRGMPANMGKPWSNDEDMNLIRSFDGGESVDQLAAKHERTLGSIKARLVKWGKLAPEEFAPRHPIT